MIASRKKQFLLAQETAALLRTLNLARNFKFLLRKLTSAMRKQEKKLKGARSEKCYREPC
jgi:hypothetical protein